MQIKIPRSVARTWSRVLDQVNVPVVQRADWEIRRIDIAAAIGFALCVTYYYATMGLQGAILGGLLYAFAVMAALWLL